MSQNETGLKKNLDFMRALSIIILLTNIYYYCYPFFDAQGWTIGIADRILLNFQRNTGLFSSPLNTELFALLFLAFSCLGVRGRKDTKITRRQIWLYLAAGLLLYFGSSLLLYLRSTSPVVTLFYITILGSGYIFLLTAGVWISRIIKNNVMDDVFNDENESFQQETRLITNEYSVNLPTRFRYQGQMHDGWINVVNPFRATIVLGTPGSGKSYAVINNYIRQQIEKGFAMYIYDFKFPDLSMIAYNHLLGHRSSYKEHPPQFFVLNFDDPRRSHRCNPINPKFLTDIADAYESAYVTMLNLNKTWVWPVKSRNWLLDSDINCMI